MSQPVNNSDAVDIELTVDDVKTLAPEQIVMIHDNLRRSRAAVKEDLEHARDAAQRVQAEVNRMRLGWREAEERERRLESALAHLTVNVVMKGVFEELFEEDL